MNTNELIEILTLLNNNASSSNTDLTINSKEIDEFYVSKKCIIRTYSDGVWFGTVKVKFKDEVILSKARMLWSFQTPHGLATSAISKFGLIQSNSKCDCWVDDKWCQPISILPCTQKAIDSIESAPTERYEED